MRQSVFSIEREANVVALDAEQALVDFRLGIAGDRNDASQPSTPTWT